MPAENATTADVATWMLEELKHASELYQEDAVDEIIRRFGEQFSYTNENGNPAISRDVLKAFRSITGDQVVWERGNRVWRFRERDDSPSRLQE